MFEKTKEFFSNKVKPFFDKKIVKIIEGFIILAGGVGLLIAGLTTEQLVSKTVTVVVGSTVIIEAIVTLVQGFTTKNESN